MTTKRQIARISDKLSQVENSFTVNMYDNGYLLEISGRKIGGQDEYGTARILVPTIEQLMELVKEAADMPLSE